MSATVLDVRNLRLIPLKNQFIPTEGPKTIPLNLDFTAASQYTIDLSQTEQQGRMGYVQCVFIDLSGCDVSLVLNCPNTLQNITAKGRTQGYYPVLISNPSVMTFTCAGGTANVVVQLINVPIPGSVWATQ